MLQRGDVFGVYGKSFISRLIQWVTRIQSQDNRAKASHAGIIISDTGMTFEALSDRIKRSNIDDYKGLYIVVARHKDMDKEKFWKGFDAVRYHEKKIYPYLRLILHAIPVISKLSMVKIPVCSELVAEFLYKATNNKTFYDNLMTRYQNWYGWNPDELEDDWRVAKDFDIIFEGVWGT